MTQDRNDRIESLEREMRRYEAKGDDIVARCLRHFSEQLKQIERNRSERT
ncbi:MAG: hypothetical protein IKG65_06125 [Exiguobacterium sp.]|uniref:Uncharacterized protein n=1 Tax=Exiguobacterium profundum TaxID=307643 RepID=A0ABY8B3J9_9BACL|nr:MULTISPECIES: hypothetical protein [Exiguobacterium]MBQ6459522.1 hypothetical protein [Exiguobacterium sp.]MBR3061974.1 hypothetical protein [Exiguobacterium sp.]WED56163.1 hypothetical protein OE059_04705 [Exiguobacterium profundum]